jgi:hypothetical protein
VISEIPTRALPIKGLQVVVTDKPLSQNKLWRHLRIRVEYKLYLILVDQRKRYIVRRKKCLVPQQTPQSILP